MNYDIFIHDSKKYIDNLEPNQMVKIGKGEVKEIFITKSNLKLISTEEDPCVSDDGRVTRSECLPKYVSGLSTLLCPVSFKRRKKLAWLSKHLPV